MRSEVDHDLEKVWKVIDKSKKNQVLDNQLQTVEAPINIKMGVLLGKGSQGDGVFECQIEGEEQ